MRFLVLLVAFVACVHAEAKAMGPIAVLNLEEVIKHAKIYTTRMESLKQESDDAETKLKAMEEQDKKLKGQLEVINRGNERYAQIEEEVEVLKVRKKQFYDRARANLERRSVAIVRDCVEILRSHLKEFCQSNGIKLVHLAPMTDLNAPTMRDFQLMLNLQTVLYYDDSLDITAAFLPFVNGRFAADQEILKSAPKPEAKPGESKLSLDGDDAGGKDKPVVRPDLKPDLKPDLTPVPVPAPKAPPTLIGPAMRVTVNELARLVDGTIIGDGEQVLTGISSLTEANPGDISFLANPKYAPFLAETKATAVLVASPQKPHNIIQVVVANADYAFAKVVATYGPRAPSLPPGVHPTAIVGEQVRLGRNVAIGPYVVIADGAAIGDNTVLFPHVFIGAETTIGKDCLIYPQVSIRERCAVGDRVIIHSGAVIGSDGFGYASVEGVHHKIPQVGTVVVEDDVEIGANTTIDRARFGRTRIGKGTKIDNLVQLAHNVETGGGCIIVAQVGVAGSTKLGNYVTLAGQCGVGGHLEIGDQAIVTAQAGVSKNVPPKTVVRGYPAQEIKVSQTQEVAVRRLPQTQQTVKALESRIAELEAKLAALLAKPEKP